MYILNIETATRNCSVSLAKSGKTIAYKEIADQGYTHAENLHVFIEEVLATASIKINDLNAVAVSCGPGSYTGLRIGVSAAKGLCYALKIPLIAVDTLNILAEKVTHKNGLIIPMIDARRMEVYSAVFDENKNQIRTTQAEILTENSFSEYQETIYFVGDSTEKAKTILNKPNFVFLDNIVFPSARDISSLAYEKYIQNHFEDVAYFEPFYLKDFLITK
jgi:tRNA threonylcarbamoyladenosine biosynthesis protein TsaB